MQRAQVWVFGQGICFLKHLSTLLKHLVIISKSFICKYNLKYVLTISCALKKYTCFGALTEAYVIIIIINNSLHLYSAFLGTQRASHGSGEYPQPPPMLQHPPGWGDGSHIAPECPPHTSLLVERRQSDEANQYMGMTKRPWWSEANGRILPVCRVNTPTLFRMTSWDF